MVGLFAAGPGFPPGPCGAGRSHWHALKRKLPIRVLQSKPCWVVFTYSAVNQKTQSSDGSRLISACDPHFEVFPCAPPPSTRNSGCDMVLGGSLARRPAISTLGYRLGLDALKRKLPIRVLQSKP